VTGQLHAPADLPQGKEDKMMVPVAARSKAWVCGRSPDEIVGSNPTGGHGYLPVVSVVCCQVEVSAPGHHPSRGVLPTVVRRCVGSTNIVNKEALDHWGLLRPPPSPKDRRIF
jgi:hypothetical protein